MSAPVLTSCAKPIIDGATDATGNQSVVDTGNGTSNSTENLGGDSETDDNGSENKNASYIK